MGHVERTGISFQPTYPWHPGTTGNKPVSPTSHVGSTGWAKTTADGRPRAERSTQDVEELEDVAEEALAKELAPISQKRGARSFARGMRGTRISRISGRNALRMSRFSG